jgi:sulfatase modifying factor 1
MLRNLSLFGALLAIAACFPDLSQYEGEGDAGSTSANGTTTGGTPTSSSSTASSASSTPTTSSSAGDGGSGAGNPGAGGDTTSNGGDAPGSSTDSSSSSSSGGGGGAVDPCLAPIDGSFIQDGVLVAGNSSDQDYAFCIDKAEVTHESYRAFYDDVVATGFDLAAVYDAKDACASWKDPSPEALVPALINMSATTWANTTNPDLPIMEVDFCDAAAYCAWSGKRLCGGINGSEIAYKQQQPRNEWYLACSHNGERRYTYNADGEYDDVTYADCTSGEPSPETCPAFHMGTCRDDAQCPGWTGLWTEEGAGDCRGFDPRLVNLSGNVAEWIDACAPGGGTISGYRCETRGGSCPMNYYTICDYPGRDDETEADTRALYTGFRCCWDPEEG